MNCEKIKAVLMTDFMDNECSGAVQEEVVAHLKACGECRSFEQLLRRKVWQPFRAIKAVKPPEEIWQRIKDSIEAAQAPRVAPGWSRILDLLRGNYLSGWRPVFGISTVMVAILVTVLVVQSPLSRNRLVKESLQEKSDYLLSLHHSLTQDMNGDADFDTTIEHYFF
ncbi:MAG: anti-sigma factor [Candidatus Omnitrophota bacterium]|jgi:anti-sigma factor RsiW